MKLTEEQKNFHKRKRISAPKGHVIVGPHLFDSILPDSYLYLSWGKWKKCLRFGERPYTVKHAVIAVPKRSLELLDLVIA